MNKPTYPQIFGWLSMQRRAGVSGCELVARLRELELLSAWLRLVDEPADYFHLQAFLP